MTPTSDALGRSTTISATVPPMTKRLAAVITAKGGLGFKAETDAIRWAVEFGLRELAKRVEDSDITGVVSVMDSWSAVAKENLEHMFYEDHIKSIEAHLNTLVARGHAVKVESIIDIVWQQYDRIDDPYWREVYRTRVKALRDRVKRTVERDKKKKRKAGDDDGDND